MSTEVEYSPEQSAMSLVNGILKDLQDLVEQQFQLTRREIEEELRRRSSAAAIFGLGIGILFLGGITFCLTAAHLLHWAVSPTGTDPGGLPLWACHGSVAMVLTIAGCILVYVGQAGFRAINVNSERVSEN